MIKVDNLRKSFGSLEVLKGVSLHIQKGEVVSIVGPSGAGKSTLLQIIGSLDSADSGEVIINNTNISQLNGDKLADFRNRSIGFVFQFHHLLPEFTAVENVMLPALISGEERSSCLPRAMELLKSLSLEARADHKPAQLSGGEAQRVAIARAMINSPAIILADEPSGNLDTTSRDEMHRLLLELRDKTGVTIIIVTHDTDLAQRTDRKIEIIDGVIR